MLVKMLSVQTSHEAAGRLTKSYIPCQCCAAGVWAKCDIPHMGLQHDQSSASLAEPVPQCCAVLCTNPSYCPNAAKQTGITVLEALTYNVQCMILTLCSILVTLGT